MYKKITRYIYNFIFHLFYKEQWCIVITNKVSGETKVIKPPLDRFWADPMVIKEGDLYYIYIEELEYYNNKGYLTVFSLNETDLIPEKIYHNIINKPYHLSYPHTFMYEGERYMIPESNRNKSIDLYKMTTLPDKWVFVTTLFENVIASDTVVFFHDERWWLFTTLKDEAKGYTALNNLHIFYSNDLINGTWTSHVMNPVVLGKHHSRSAGPIYLKGDKIIRPSQNCRKRYGQSVVLNQITRLTIDCYKEEIEREIIPSLDSQVGLHTYVECGDLIVTDGMFRRHRWNVEKQERIITHYSKGAIVSIKGNKGFISFPSSEAINPFVKILNTHLSGLGWTERKDKVWLKPYSLFKIRKEVKILYFHWPESIWRSSSFIISGVKALSFIIFLYYCKLIGIKLVFSRHNVLPHYKPGNKYLEYFMRRWVLKYFDLVIDHSRNAQSSFDDTFKVKPRRRVLALHGLYDKYYQFNCTQNEARVSLGLPSDKCIVLLHYNQNSYKGSLPFLKSWCKENRTDFLLVIGDLTDEVVSLISDYNNCKIIKNDVIEISGTVEYRYLSEEMLLKNIIAADYVALPYVDITTSGAYFMAISYDKPVIAPDLPFFKLHTTPQTALLYDAKTNKIGNAINKIHNGWRIDKKELAALKKEFDWNESASQIAKSFDKITGYA
ncbi:MAG: hypothetical protein H7282_08890 [Cytophagaceae bacterium]|nr:hypothetical protein [Cytophagaceae bacterium]